MAWISGFITYKWAVLSVFVVSAVLWSVLDIVSYFVFKQHVASLGFPSVKKHNFFAVFTRAANVKDSRNIGSIWFARGAHWLVIIIAVGILVYSICRAVMTQHSLELSRAGALVVIAGLLAVILGLLESRETRRAWEKAISLYDSLKTIDNEKKVELKKNSIELIEESQYFAAKVSVVISVIGTILWAYGDQMLACGFFPIFGIADKSGVVCLGS